MTLANEKMGDHTAVATQRTIVYGFLAEIYRREVTPELLSRVSILPTIRRPLRIQPVHHRHQPILYHHLPQ